jgi:hypothetical protein
MKEMLFHPKSTLEFYCWAIPFLDSFLTFWDSEVEEFILTDNGMTSEYETCHHVFGGLDISKYSYLLKNLTECNKNKNSRESNVYAKLLESTILMFENFNIFNLSSHRSIILANPFFRLYASKKLMFIVDGKRIELNLSTPDIWPSVIQEQKAFEVPENHYVHLSGVQYSDDDEFIYHPFVLSSFDTMYINTLLLSSTHDLIGFGKIENIVNSIFLYIWMTGMNKFAEDDNPVTLATSVLSDHFNQILNHAESKGIKTSINVDDVFHQMVAKRLYDLNNNLYMIEYLLSDLPRLKEKESHFSFIGNFDEIVCFFQRKRDQLKQKV